MENQIADLAAGVSGVQGEQDYMKIREQAHRNSTSLFLSILSLLFLSSLINSIFFLLLFSVLVALVTFFSLKTVNESTNARVLWWSIFEALVLVAMSAWQVYYLRRFFEVKRVV